MTHSDDEDVGRVDDAEVEQLIASRSAAEDTNGTSPAIVAMQDFSGSGDNDLFSEHQRQQGDATEVDVPLDNDDDGIRSTVANGHAHSQRAAYAVETVARKRFRAFFRLIIVIYLFVQLLLLIVHYSGVDMSAMLLFAPSWVVLPLAQVITLAIFALKCATIGRRRRPCGLDTIEASPARVLYWVVIVAGLLLTVVFWAINVDYGGHAMPTSVIFVPTFVYVILRVLYEVLTLGSDPQAVAMHMIDDAHGRPGDIVDNDAAGSGGAPIFIGGNGVDNNARRYKQLDDDGV